MTGQLRARPDACFRRSTWNAIRGLRRRGAPTRYQTPRNWPRTGLVARVRAVAGCRPPASRSRPPSGLARLKGRVPRGTWIRRPASRLLLSAQQGLWYFDRIRGTGERSFRGDAATVRREQATSRAPTCPAATCSASLRACQTTLWETWGKHRASGFPEWFPGVPAGRFRCACGETSNFWNAAGGEPHARAAPHPSPG